MKPIPYWIQRADFAATDHDAVDVRAARSVVESHDWNAELSLRDELEARGGDVCDPGIGFVRGEGEVLHLCPTPGGRAYVHYHHRVRRRALGVIPLTRDTLHSRFNIDRSELGAVVERWFAGDHAWLVQYLQQGRVD